jgi:hypothetical protein
MSSKKHGREMTARIIDEHLDDLLDLENHDALEEKITLHNQAIQSMVANQMNGIENSILHHKILTQNDEICLLDKTNKFSTERRFSNYKRWIAEHKPIRLENLLGLSH